MKKIIPLTLCLILFGFMTMPAKADSSSIQILSPVAGQQWAVGSTQVITWSPPASVSNVQINMSYYLACMYTTPQCLVASVIIPIAVNVPNTGSFSWSIPSNFSTGTYIINVRDVANSGFSGNSSVFSLVGSTNTNNVHSAGTNVSSAGIVYYIQAQAIKETNSSQSILIPYPSAAVFLSYGFNSWNTVVPASIADLQLSVSSSFMPYADGALVNDRGTVYIISNGSKYGIANAHTFLSLGYSWSNLVNGDTTYLPAGQIISSVQAHMPGSLINQNDTIFYVDISGKIGFPSISVFNSWGFKLKNVVIANSSDKDLLLSSNNPIANAWEMGELSPSLSSSQAQTYDNQYMKFSYPAGWTATQAGQNQAAVNVIKGNYILYINTQASQASGVTGGRFAEIAMGSPSADAVVTQQPSPPCGTSQTTIATAGHPRIDLYINSKETQSYCAHPTNGATVWYFSYITDNTGSYFNYYIPGQAKSYVVTMSYNSNVVNSFPVQGSSDLNSMLNEMTGIVKTLQIKQ